MQKFNSSLAAGPVLTRRLGVRSAPRARQLGRGSGPVAPTGAARGVDRSIHVVPALGSGKGAEAQTGAQRRPSV